MTPAPVAVEVTPGEVATKLATMLEAEARAGRITSSRPISLEGILRRWNAAPGNKYRTLTVPVLMRATDILRENKSAFRGNCAVGYYYEIKPRGGTDAN